MSILRTSLISQKCREVGSCKILLIGLDAADWGIVSAKITAGALPHLANLIASGASSSLRSLHPLFSPALWATIATGKRPYEHGITGFTLPDDAGAGIRTYDSTLRRVPALWNMFSQSGKISNVIGWWNTAPVENIRGVMVDETFRIAHRPSQEPWKVDKNSVFPEKLAETLGKERVHPQELSESLLRLLVPKLYEIDPSADLRLSGIAKILAEDLTTLQVTLRLMAQGPWDFTTLYLMGLDSLSHLGMCYRPPVLPGEKSHDVELYGELVDRAYALYDTWVGQLVAAAGKETTVVIVSDHGFYHDHRKPQSLGIEATAPCAQHAPLGTLIMAGPTIRQGVTLSHATILDICPTLLGLFGLPVGKDMSGKVLSEAFSDQSRIKNFIPSWDQCCPRPAVTLLQKPSVQATEVALRQLVALGYLPELPKDHRSAIEEAQCNQWFHLALAYLEDEQFDQALPLLEKARLQAKNTFSKRTDILATLAVSYFLAEEPRRAAAHFQQLVRCRRRDAHHATHEFLLKTSTLDPTKKLSFSEAWELRRLMARANLDEEAMSFTSALAREMVHHKASDAMLIFSLAEKRPQDFFINLHAGLTAFSHGASQAGLLFLHHAAEARSDEAEPWAFMAEHHNQKHHFSQGEVLARQALERNPLHAASWLALGTALIHQARWAEARAAALQARGSVLQRSKVYELLAMIALKEKKNARRAARYHALAQKAEQYLKVSVSSAPSQKTSFKNQFKNQVSGPLARFHGKHSKQPRVIVVSGLPRSGTSLLMQMLAAGGVPIMTDHQRPADEHNPQGYFEHEAIKKGAKDAQVFMPGAASKVVIPRLWDLPPKLTYNIIFIRRNLAEVIESQHRMAGLIGSREELENAYRYYEAKTLEIIKERSWHVLELQHAAVLARPEAAAKAINKFLGNDLNEEAMAAAVVPSLHRVRK